MLDLVPGEQLESHVVGQGISKFRAQQVVDWAYKKKADSFSQFSNLPADFRAHLEENFTLRSFTLKEKITSQMDATVRYSFKTHDGFEVVTVFLPRKNRNSICLSTQVGCPVRCVFCASGKVNFKRNLSRGEILEQILQVEKAENAEIDSILFMGMGEPLLNYDNTVSAIKSLLDPGQFGYGRRNIVLSTAGFVPQIVKLSKENVPVRLALSLHASDETTREKIIKGKIPYFVEDILDAGLEYGRETKSKVTIEYVLIDGINDSEQAAIGLAKLIGRKLIKNDRLQVNIIPYNPTGVELFNAPSAENIRIFKDCLSGGGLLATVRESRGADIGAACGQIFI
ncbi:MAG: 23S rRNA (adenine(2503)-C(2))-methyltransferase [Elusimicrobia bacterium RIFOXYB2_FULL_48_7]|nr:MAG: 23S rRNA (adenine(2503)-C(2))-methyltransferase [Elusimicrobia bacterium RIFOXYB2_FULL_48_7]